MDASDTWIYVVYSLVEGETGCKQQRYAEQKRYAEQQRYAELDAADNHANRAARNSSASYRLHDKDNDNMNA